MQTSPVRMIDYFDGRKQSVIPLFQRPYTWKKSNWDTLWQDILDCYSPDGKLEPHFMGAVVSLPVSTMPIGVNKHLIIDGQQRLTTVSVLLCVIREFLDDRVRERIQDFLINRNDEGADKFKLMPTQADRRAYECIVNEKDNPDVESHLFKVCEYFRKKIKDLDQEDGGPGALQVLEIIESALRVVMISLDPEHEDPYEIFESLNFKGTPLTPADLVRNYILMKYRHSLGENGDQERIFREYWSPIESDFQDELPQFLLHYCRLSGREVRKKGIYPAFKSLVEELNPNELESELGRIKIVRNIYPRFMHPENETDEQIGQPLRLFKLLGVTVFYPLLMRLFRAEVEGTIKSSQLHEALDILSAFLVRRSVCNLKNNALDSMVTQLLKDWNERDPAAYLSEQLSSQTGNLRWPKDQEFIHSVVHDPQYRRKAADWVLWRLEEACGHKEGLRVEKIQIEHILPQTLSDDWLSTMSEEDKLGIERWVDTFGNLTLTGYNGQLSNKGFESKRAIYLNSHFELTKAVASEVAWDIAAIKRRGETLAAAAVQVWRGPILSEITPSSGGMA